jgi:hypothetical protein
MQSLGFDIPLESGRTLWREAKAAKFGDETDDTTDETLPEAP